MTNIPMNLIDAQYLTLCTDFARQSRDPRHKVGCLIVEEHRGVVLGHGFNRFPRGVDYTEERLNNKEKKRTFMVHAEIDAILNAGSERVRGMTLYCNYRPCLSCAGFIIQAGIYRVVWEISNPSYVSPQFMFEEAGLVMSWVNE